MQYTGEIDEFGEPYGHGIANYERSPNIVFEGTWRGKELHGFCKYISQSNFGHIGTETNHNSDQIRAGQWKNDEIFGKYTIYYP